MKTIRQKIKGVFLAGLLVTLPAALTIYFIVLIFSFVDRFLGPSVTRLLINLGLPIAPTYHIPGLGLVVTILMIFVIGIIFTNFIGRKIIAISELIVDKIPIMGSVYSAFKQIIVIFAHTDSSPFKKAVMFKYPMSSIYTIGFVSSETYHKIRELIEEDVVNVFVPTVPNITTGFFFMIPRKDLIPLPMSMEDVMKTILSGGMIIPQDKRIVKPAGENKD